jgi:hypothetical protein
MADSRVKTHHFDKKKEKKKQETEEGKKTEIIEIDEKKMTLQRQRGETLISRQQMQRWKRKEKKKQYKSRSPPKGFGARKGLRHLQPFIKLQPHHIGQ